jgi:APA family basic amino acid/polyamine antiporter
VKSAATPASPPPSRLARKLGTGDAVMVGLGSMIGAGVFSAIGPATRAAGNAVVIGLLLAGGLAYCNATSSAALAALYPESGGAYVYGRKRLGAVWGFLAGWGFVVGKLASCAAMALTFGRYAEPALARPLAIAAVVVLTAVNYFGISKTVATTRVIVTLALVALAVCVTATVAGGAASGHRLWPLDPIGPHAVLQAAGLMFFAFAGYARIATLGEEVVDPARTIPRAIPIALGLTVVVYAVVAVSALAAAGSAVLATSPAPLADAIRVGRLAALAPVVRVGAAIASLGVLLSLIAGVSRTVFAMAAARDLPPVLAAVHPRYQTPHRAEIAGGIVVLLLVICLDVGDAIGFSAFTVLGYYAVANAAALTLSASERRWPRALALLGLVGCVAIALSLPRAAVVGGAIVLGAGLLAFAIRRALIVAVAIPLVLFVPSAARAVDPFEIQVYDGSMVDPGQLGVELHANSVVAGRRTAEPPELPAHHQSHFTLEGAFALTSWWELGAYFQTALLPGGSFEYAGSKLRTKLVAPRRPASPFIWGVNLELARLPEHYEADRWSAEIRPIAAWSSPTGALFAAVNPILDIGLAGPDRNLAPSFEPAATIRYVRAGLVSVGLEYYAGLGPVGRWLPAGAQEHYLYEVVDVLRWTHFELHAGVGEGLTDASNDFVVKTILGYR